MPRKKREFSLEDYFTEMAEHLHYEAISKVEKDFAEGLIPDSKIKQARMAAEQSDFHFPIDDDIHWSDMVKP